MTASSQASAAIGGLAYSVAGPYGLRIKSQGLVCKFIALRLSPADLKNDAEQ